MDTSKLTREQKLELIQLLEEKNRRALLKKPKFVPHDGQRRVIESTALERYLFCGNGNGKSTILVNEVHWAATGFNPFTNQHTPVPAKMALLIDTPEKIDDFIREFTNWNPLEEDQLHKKGKPNYSFITWSNGSTLTVLTHDVTPLKLEGSQWTHIFMDEPPPKPVFTALFRGGRIKGRPCRVLLAGTPVSAAWLRTDIYEPWAKGELEDVEVFRGTTDENAANLDPGWFKRFFGKLSEHEAKVRRLGDFYDLEGLALSHVFRRATHVVPAANFQWDRSWPCVIAIDPHTSKPSHAVLMGVDREGRIYVLDEYKEKGVARKFAKSLIGRGWFTDYRILDIVYDNAGNAEMTSGEGFAPFGNVFNEVMSQHGLGRARATSYDDKSDEAFIDRIQDGLYIENEGDIPKIRVLSTCKGSIGDFENVQWKRDKNAGQNKPTLEISNRDWLACIKYGLACNLYFEKRKDRAYYTNKKPYGVNLQERRQESKRAGRIGYRVAGAKPKAARDDDW